MGATKSWAVIGFLVIASWWGYSEIIAKPERRDKQAQRQHEKEDKRFNEWAYIAKDKEIKPGEHLKLIIVPSSWGEYFDTKCLIYTNDDLKQSSMICPDSTRESITDK